MSTPISGSASYCSGAQFLVRFDVRTVAECLSDNDVPLDESSVATNTKLVSLLKGSSGKLEAAALLGGKYTPTDLAALTGNMAEWIADIVADLAAPKVLGRRFIEFPDFAERLKEAEGVLSALAEGRLIFGLQEVIDAGVMDDTIESADVVEERNMITLQAGRYFGRRANRVVFP